MSFLFNYDESGNPIGLTFNDLGNSIDYYYVTNLQGDVIQIVDEEFNVACNYYYDAWGAIRQITDGSGADITDLTYGIAYLNPIRYRGYYYDVETGLYYLQTRYYDPVIGRFISRDSYEFIGANGDLGSYNLFAYCSNNPLMYVDSTGEISKWALTVAGVVISVATGFISANATGQEYTWIDAGISALSGAATAYYLPAGIVLTGTLNILKNYYYDDASLENSFLRGTISSLSTYLSVSNLVEFKGDMYEFLAIVVSDMVFGTGNNIIASILNNYIITERVGGVDTVAPSSSGVPCAPLRNTIREQIESLTNSPYIHRPVTSWTWHTEEDLLWSFGQTN